MKTHTARWYRNSPTTWILKERTQDGGAVLATIRDALNGSHYLIEVGDEKIIARSYYAAQRAARKALEEQEHGA